MAVLNTHIVTTSTKGANSHHQTWQAFRRTADGKLYYQIRDTAVGTFNNGGDDLSSDADYVTETVEFIANSEEIFTGDGSTKIFTSSLNRGTDADRYFITIDSNPLVADTDFTVNGTSITFTIAPHNGAYILFRKINKRYLNTGTDLFQQYRFETGQNFYDIDTRGRLVRHTFQKARLNEIVDDFGTYDGDSLINPTTYQDAV